MLRRTMTREEALLRVEPLQEHLKIYEAARLRLERHGGTVLDMRTMAEIIGGRFLLVSREGVHRPAHLLNPTILRRWVSEITDGIIHLEIAAPGDGLPVYYLCRLHRSADDTFGFIAEDLHLSAGFPLHDTPFARLRAGGSAVYWPRLAPWRSATAAMLGDFGAPAIDACLAEAGTRVFAAAWHESGIPRERFSRCLGLEALPRVAECLHFALTSHPGAVKPFLYERMLEFFRSAYVSRPLRLYLGMIMNKSGVELDRVHAVALHNMRMLRRVWARLLSTECEWGPHRRQVSLSTILHANYSRLAVIADLLRADHQVRLACLHAERDAESCLRNLLAGRWEESYHYQNTSLS